MRIRFLQLFTFVFAVCSCREPVSVKAKESPPESSKLESFLKDFTKSHSNSDTINSILEKEFLKKIDKDILSDLPLKLKGIKKMPGSKYAAHFGHSFHNSPGLVGFNIDLITLMDRTGADTLVTDSSYFINGVNAFNISKSYQPFADGSTYSNSIKIKRDYGYDADLGVIMVTLKSISKK